MTINYNTENFSRQIETENKAETIAKIKNFFDFAFKKNIQLGYLRGSSFSNPILRNLMRNDFSSFNLRLFPEVWINGGLNFSLDVEFEKGNQLIEHFQEYKIFRLPIIDIIGNTEESLPNKNFYKNHIDNSPEFLRLFKNGKLDRVWGLDQKPETKSYEEIFYNENLSSIEDTLNLYLLNTTGNLDLLNEYQDRKNLFKKGIEGTFSVILERNFGTVIYHEDIIEIIHHYMGWDYLKCDLMRRNLRNDHDRERDWEECQKIMGKDVASSVFKSCKKTFSKAHLYSTYTIIKKSLILRNLFEYPYLKAIRFFEQKFSLPWNYYEK